MVKPCPNCGAKTVAEARFCRSCGTPLRASGLHDTDPPVSPQAQTVPLAGEARPTDGLSPDDERPQAANTTRVGREEIEQILRRVQADYADIDNGKKGTPDAAKSAKPQETVRLAPESVATTQASDALSTPLVPASARESQFAPTVRLQSAPTFRKRRQWLIVAITLLCFAVAAGIWILIHSHKASVPNTSSASQTQASEEKTSERAKTSETEAQPLPEQTVEPAPSTAQATNQAAKNMEHPKATRNDSQTNATQTNAQKSAEPSASPTPSVTPVPKTNAAQIDADAYYFKGVNMVNGREPKSLSDGELNAALNYFLRAQGGAHSQEAKRYADRLGREFDRRRKR